MRMVTRFTMAAVAAALLGSTSLAQQGRGDRPNNRRGQAREDASLKVGQLAPTFALSSVDGTEHFELKEFRGKKPVVLYFGSYT